MMLTNFLFTSESLFTARDPWHLWWSKSVAKRNKAACCTHTHDFTFQLVSQHSASARAELETPKQTKIIYGARF